MDGDHRQAMVRSELYHRTSADTQLFLDRLTYDQKL